MFMSHDEAELLVTQVQHAHRLLAGFYQRVLPAIDNLAGHYNATFWYWEPSEFSRPCGTSTRPSSKWAWDFLPLVATRLVYVKNEAGGMRSDDLVMEFHLRCDPAVLREERDLRQERGQPDPTSLPPISPTLKVYLYRPLAELDTDLKQAWEEAEHPSGSPKIFHSVAENLEGAWLEIPLAEFACSPQGLSNEISQLVGPTV